MKMATLLKSYQSPNKGIMKKIHICIIVLISMSLTFCGSKEDPTPQNLVDPDPIKEVVDGIAKTWEVNSVSLDGMDVSDDWSGFTLAFDKSKNYTAAELSVKSILVWPVKGSYTIPNTSNPNNLLRNDGIQIVLSNVTASTLKLSFTISGRSAAHSMAIP